MKLIQKINRQYIVSSFLVLVIAGVALFVVLRITVNEEIDEKLTDTCQRIALQNNGNLPEMNFFPIISVQKTNSDSVGESFTDTVLTINTESEEFRQLTAYRIIDGTKYRIIVRESGLESNDLLLSLTLVVLGGFSILLFLLNTLNKYTVTRLWKPFFNNLEKLKSFSLAASTPFNPDMTTIDEFEEMSRVMKELTDRVISDYHSLKKFTGNASHELQTPLAIIRAKTEALLGEENLTSSQIEKIQSVYQSANRLSKINQALLLLTKIENNQFNDHEEISMDELIGRQLNYFSELMIMKELAANYKCDSDWVFTGNRTLTEILINNLLSNAILHNTARGQVYIKLRNHHLSVANTAIEPIVDSQIVFERFYKGAGSGSTGLGLAISKQICTNQGLSISHSVDKHLQVFTVERNQNRQT